MATPAQKNFRNEMRQLQKEGYSPYDNIYNPRPQRKQKWSWGIGAALLIAFIISGLPQFIYNEITIHHDQKIRQYLMGRAQLFDISDLQFKQMLTQINNSSHDELPALLPYIQETSNTLQGNYNALYKLDPPKGFQDLHDDTLSIFVLKKAALDYLLTAIPKRKVDYNVLSTYVAESNRQLQSLTPSLIKGLQEANLRYRINQDGSLTYWVKDHVYHNNFNKNE